MSDESLRSVFIVGPTASGKSAAAMQAAQSTAHSEIFCLDKSTAWAEMNIGTAKPSMADRMAIRHQLVSVFHMGNARQHWPPGFPALNSKFGEYPDNVSALLLREARAQMNGLRRIGGAAICVGGSSALYEGLYEGYDYPVVAERCLDAKLLALSAMNRRQALSYMQENDIHAPYAPDDECSDDWIDPQILLEQIIEAETRRHGGNDMRNTVVVGIDVADNILQDRIRTRTDHMLEQGLEGEVRRLIHKYGWALPLSSTVGYKEFRSRVAGGAERYSLNSVVDLINANTIRYAHRQRQWLYGRPEIHWTRHPEEAAELAIEALREGD
jgi:tRNA dimethylallyltransferase